MNDITFNRQEGIVDSRLLDIPITIIGAGGIGSMTIIQLIKMGATNLTVYDMDTVEGQNLPNSFFVPQLIDKNKADAIRTLGHLFSGKLIKAIPEKYTNQLFTEQEIIIAAPDNMEARQAIWKNVKHTNIKLYIDARMSAEFMDIFIIKPNDIDDVNFYEKHTLNIKDEDTVQEACTSKAIIYNTAGIGSYICNAIKRSINHQDNPARIMMDYNTLTLQAVESKKK